MASKQPFLMFSCNYNLHHIHFDALLAKITCSNSAVSAVTAVWYYNLFTQYAL